VNDIDFLFWFDFLLVLIGYKSESFGLCVWNMQNPLCSYYMWGDDYARYIEKKGFVRSEVVTHYLLKTQILRLEMEIERLKEEVEFIGKELGGTDQLKEEIRVLKMQLVQHKQVVEGTVKMAVRWGKIFAVLYAAIAILVVMHIFLAVVN